jgi:hypothetical protein
MSGIDPFISQSPNDGTPHTMTALPAKLEEGQTPTSDGHESLPTSFSNSQGLLPHPLTINDEYCPTRPLPSAPPTERPIQAPAQLAGDDASLLDRMTLYTLPSYNEQMFQHRAEARDLSEADIHAISRRLRDFMRVHGEQNGANTHPNGIGDTLSPRELIGRLMDERLRAREGCYRKLLQNFSREHI